MDRILTQDEIDRLVQSLEAPEEEAGTDKNSTEESIKTYDFRNPTKLSKEQMQLLHQTCSRLFHHMATFFSAKTRRIIEAKLDSLHELPYQEFVRSIPLPCLLIVLGIPDTGGFCILHIELPIAYVFYDILCGGDGKSDSLGRNTEPTEVELRVIRRVMQDALEQTISLEVGESTSFSLQLRSIETSPHNIQGLAINDTAVLARCTISVGDVSGRMHLAIPYESLKPVLKNVIDSNISQAVEDDRQKLKNSQILDAPVRFQVILGEVKLSINDLLDLQAGDLIALDKKVGDPVDVVLGDKPRFQGMPGVYGNHLAVRITNRVNSGRKL